MIFQYTYYFQLNFFLSTNTFSSIRKIRWILNYPEEACGPFVVNIFFTSLCIHKIISYLLFLQQVAQVKK